MPNPLHHGLNKQLREIADRFHNLCLDHGLQYTIEADTHNEQGYLIHGHDVDHTSVKLYMEDFLNDRWVAMDVEPNNHGSYFKFTVQPLYEYSEDVEYLDVKRLAEANLDALNGVKDYDDWLVALHTERKIDPIVVSDDGMQVVEGLGLLKALIEMGGIRGGGMAPIIKENQYKQPTSRHRRAFAPFSGSSNQPAKTFGGVSTDAKGGSKKSKKSKKPVKEDQYKTSENALDRAASPRAGSSNEAAATLGGGSTAKKKKKKKVHKEDIGTEYTLAKTLLAHDNSTVIPKGSKITVVDDDPELPDIRLEDGRIVNVDMDELKLCIKESVKDRLDRVVSENMVAIALPDIIGAVGAPHKDFEASHGNMEAEFEGPSGPPPSAMAARVTGALDGMASEFGLTMGGDSECRMCDTLNKLWAGEVTAILQYELFYVTAPSLHMPALQKIFQEHQDSERKHARMLTQRITELGGTPATDLCELADLSAHGIDTPADAAGMIAVLKYQEAIAVKAYRAAIDEAQDDPATRNMLEEILRDEEEHLSDMESMIDGH